MQDFKKIIITIIASVIIILVLLMFGSCQDVWFYFSTKMLEQHHCESSNHSVVPS